MNEYKEFLNKKIQLGSFNGFKPIFLPDCLFDFQKKLTEWAILKGRCAIFADCGLGKTFMQLVWAENIVRKTNKNILIITPLAVSNQTIKEGEKFGIEVKRSINGNPSQKITVTNYEKLHLFNSTDFIGVVCDESSILKNFNGKRKSLIIDFMKKLPYRLCCTATASPNDYIELGNTSEALGELGYMDMLGRFFKNDQNTTQNSSGARRWAKDHMYQGKWRFKKHAEDSFWRWVSSWARAIRKPSDVECDDNDFILPKLIENEITVKTNRPLNGMLFTLPAIGLKEQREERNNTINERCEKVCQLLEKDKIAIAWCTLNNEGDLLEKIIKGSVQISGSDSDEKKEEIFNNFSDGKIRVLITKPKIGGFGMNWQHCNHITFFPSHSYEQYYQSIRRCWRYGQKKIVTADIIISESENNVLKNLQRKLKAADKMFSSLVAFMNNSLKIKRFTEYNKKEEIPLWL